jgi:hypothetical protein
MTLGDWITWITLAAGTFALLRLAYRRWQPWLRYYASIIYYAIDDYVQQSQAVREVNQNARVPDTDAIVPVSVPPRTTGSEPVPNRETLIRLAALTVNEDGSYTYSANKIAEFIGGARGATLEAIRAARGQEEPQPIETHIFERTGPRQTFKRTGVKPLRG